MRLARLDLTRYGKFTDKSIDFGPRVDGEPDFHILFGPNESGKSTTLSAYLDLLYGIELHGREKRSRYSFKHPETTMRVGALLESESGARRFVRIRRPQNSLLDDSEQPVSDGVLAGELGGLDRTAYRAMFSLDDDTIESGGESILQSKGDLGQLLFSASAGLADLSQQLAAIREKADSFYRKRAHNGELQEFKKQLTSLRDERTRIDTLASQFAQLIAAKDAAKALYDGAAKESGINRSRLDEVVRLLSALPRLSALQRLREQLGHLEALPVAPVGAVDELKQLQHDEVDLSLRLEAAEGEAGRLRTLLDAAMPDEKAFGLSPLLDRLSILRARHVAAIEDLPKRQLELNELDNTISGILERLERPYESDPKRLVLKTTIVANLRALIEQKASISAKSATAAQELEAAQQRLEAASERYRLAGGAEFSEGQNEKLAMLAATVTATRAGNSLAVLASANRDLEREEAELQKKLELLLPWIGSADDLVRFPVPDASVVARWKSQILNLQKKLDRSAEDVERLKKEQVTLDATVSELGRCAGVVDDAKATEIRTARNKAWAAHRNNLSDITADLFAGLLREDDEATQARITHIAELSELRQAGVGRAKTNAELVYATRILEDARAALSVVHSDILISFTVWKSKAADEHAIDQIESWLRLRDEALVARTRRLEAQRAQKDAESAIQAERGSVARALTECNSPVSTTASLEELLNAAEAKLASYRDSSALRQEVDSRRRDTAKREDDKRKADEAESEWDAAWSYACRTCWLGEVEPIPNIDQVRELLKVAADLGPELEKRAGLAGRVDKMKKDQAEFVEETSQHLAALKIEQKGDILAGYAVIEERVQSAKMAAELTQQRVDELAAADATHRGLVAKKAVHETRKSELLHALGAPTLPEASEVLEKIGRRTDLLAQSAEATDDILQALGAANLEESEAILKDLDRSALEAERGELTARHQVEAERLQELFSELRKAGEKIEAVGGDETVAKLEERRKTILLQIEDGARSYLKLRLGVTATERALRIYRDTHRSTMMARASQAFKTISRGAYERLVPQPGKDGDVLVAVSAEGGSKLAHELSKGTRFQLYLALRFAGYYEFTSSRRSVPFIADDIMETFDDDRSEEAFTLFAEIAKSGQVIYMTHHRHLCDLAMKVCPSVRVHTFD